MQRISVPMIGGMVSSIVLTLVVIPAIYVFIKSGGLADPEFAPARSSLRPGNPYRGGQTMMDRMMDGMGWGMGFGGLLAAIVLALVIAALVKYVFFR